MVWNRNVYTYLKKIEYMNSKTFKKIETKRYGNLFHTFFIQPENLILSFSQKNL